MRGMKNRIDHVVKGDGLKVVIEARIKGRKTGGIPRMGTIDDLMEGMCPEMKRKVEDFWKKWKVWMPRTCQQAEND